MAKIIPLTTTIELEAKTLLALGPGGGFRQPPTINTTNAPAATFITQQIRADRTGTTLRLVRGYTINAYPTNTNNPNPTEPTTLPPNPTAGRPDDIIITAALILNFDAISTTVYALNQPFDSANIYEQILVGNWLGYLTAETKGLKNIIPYSGVLLGENKITDLRLTNTNVLFTTAKIKPGTAKSTGDGLITVWTYSGKPIDKTIHTQLTQNGYKIPPIGPTGYSQSTINLNFILNGPASDE